MADAKYHLFRKTLKLQNIIPSLNQVIKIRHSLDSICSVINANKSDIRGVSNNWEQKIGQILPPLLTKLGYFNPENIEITNGTKKSTKKIVIKLAADGTNIGRVNKLLNHTFTVINDISMCRSANGNYSLGLYSITNEDYFQTKACLSKALSEIEKTKSIMIEDVIFNILLTNGGDMKYLLNIYGINSSISKHPCLWCTTECSAFHRFRQPHAKRTLEQAKALYLTQKLGYTKLPITTIDFDCCIIDLLHMMLRIFDQLFDHLFAAIQLLDGSKDDLDLSTKPNLNKLFLYLEYDLFIKHPMQPTKDGKMRLRSLNGLERLKVLESINLVELFPELEDRVELQQLWRGFFNIYVSLKNPNGYPKDQMAALVKESTLAWGNLYTSISWRGSVTPYIHAFVDHLHEMIAEHGEVCLWTMQGLEKLNDILSKEFFMCTNKHDDFLVQMIKRRNRMELMLLFSQDPEKLFNLIHSAPEATWSSF